MNHRFAPASIGELFGFLFGLFFAFLLMDHVASAQVDEGSQHRPRISSVLRAGNSSLSSEASAFDIGYYHLTLNLEANRSPVLIGRVRIEGTALSDLDAIVLDLLDNMVVDFVFSASGQVLAFDHDQDLLTITPGSSLFPGERYALDVIYHGTPQNRQPNTFRTGIRNGGQPFIWTLSEPFGAREWWPSEDHPSDKADSVRVTVTVEEPMVVGSNGLLESEVHHDDGTVTFNWIHRYPISSYLVSIAAGVYERTTDVYRRPTDLAQEFGHVSFPIEHYAYPDIPAYEGISSASGWHLTSTAMAVLEGWFGPYPFENEKYGNAHVTFRGGMEHQTLSSMGNIGIELISHELAHQWFGDKLTPLSWADLWLNEGFATLGEMLVFESDEDFSSVHDVLSDLYYSRAKNALGTLVLQDTTNESSMFSHARVYSKGWMVLRMIRGMTGNEVFRDILRSYASLEGVSYGSSRTEDFQAVVETKSARSFETFFDQWVYSGTGYPRYEALLEDISIPPLFRARITLEQVQGADESNVDVFEMPVELEIQTTTGSFSVVVDNSERTQVFEIDVPAEPVSVDIDPDRWILRGATSSATDIVLAEIPEGAFSLSVYPNPAESVLKFRVEGASSARPVAELYDILGRLIWTRPLGRAAEAPLYVEIDDIHLSSGSYLLRVRDAGHSKVKVVTVRGR